MSRALLGGRLRPAFLEDGVTTELIDEVYEWIGPRLPALYRGKGTLGLAGIEIRAIAYPARFAPVIRSFEATLLGLPLVSAQVDDLEFLVTP